MSRPTTQTSATSGSNGRAASASRRKSKEKVKPTFKENVQFWVKAILIILFLRAFIFEPYRIPSESMEDTLLVGDFLIVSKLHYGARTPNTLGIPFTRIYVPGVEFPQTRLPGFSEVQRGDVAVFNYPARVDVERGTIPADVPVERRAPYIKRITAVAGDTVAIVDKLLLVNQKPHPLSETMKQRWTAHSVGTDRPTMGDMAEEGIQFIRGTDVRGADGRRQFDVVATPGGARALQAEASVAEVKPFTIPDTLSFLDPRIGAGMNPDLIYGPAKAWNQHQYGPIVVPAAGMTIPATEETMAIYREPIEQYEGVEVAAQRGGGFLFNGVPRDAYTFRQNYYFLMGDNRDNSVDSRYWGFVPETHLVGKAVFTFLSFRRFLPPIPRLNRFFRPIP